MDRRHPKRLCKVALANTGVPKHEYVIMLLDKSACGKFEDERAIKAGIEAPVEGIECLCVAKAGALNASSNESISPPLQFVVNEESEEVRWPERISSRLLSANGKGVSHAAQAELAQGTIEFIVGHRMRLLVLA
jgi:hypothetical protein